MIIHTNITGQYQIMDNNNNNLFEKQQNERLVPQIVTKLIRGGTRRIQEHT